MKFFWDTSAAINAAVSPRGKARLDADEHAARVHWFSEFFSIMTGRGIPGKDGAGDPVRVTFAVDAAAQWLRDFAAKVRLVELEGAEMLNALERARSRHVQGARVYDYAHALAAIKCGAEVVLTRNTKHFDGLTGAARLEWP